MLRKTVSDLGQWFGGMLVALGIIIELEFKAPLGFLIITIGSFGFAIATKFKYYGKKR